MITVAQYPQNMYNKIDTKEKLKTVIWQFYEREPSKREFVVSTGIAGAKMIDRAIKVEFLMQMLGELVAENKVTQEELTSIQEMIKSPDYENHTVAQSIMEEYGKQR